MVGFIASERLRRYNVSQFLVKLLMVNPTSMSSLNELISIENKLVIFFKPPRFLGAGAEGL